MVATKVLETTSDTSEKWTTVTIHAGLLDLTTLDNQLFLQTIVNEFASHSSDPQYRNTVCIDVSDQEDGPNTPVYLMKDLLTSSRTVLDHVDVNDIIVYPVGQVTKIVSLFLIPIIGLETYKRITWAEKL